MSSRAAICGKETSVLASRMSSHKSSDRQSRRPIPVHAYLFDTEVSTNSGSFLWLYCRCTLNERLGVYIRAVIFGNSHITSLPISLSLSISLCISMQLYISYTQTCTFFLGGMNALKETTSLQEDLGHPNATWLLSTAEASQLEADPPLSPNPRKKNIQHK